MVALDQTPGVGETPGAYVIHLHEVSPPRLMFLGESDQILDLNDLTVIGHGPAVIAPKYLVYFTKDDAQIRLRQALFEGDEGQVEAAFIIGELPRFHVIAG